MSVSDKFLPESCEVSGGRRQAGAKTRLLALQMLDFMRENRATQSAREIPQRSLVRVKPAIQGKSHMAAVRANPFRSIHSRPVEVDGILKTRHRCLRIVTFFCRTSLSP